ncbi:MAG TPA: HAD-IA family hydrolase [Thermoanaerobaculia bacterium]|nr:HAD-IA family hydrolase [Thermoanaerobaculia bacterium]
MTTAITHLFTDLGGVLLTNGWDHNLRHKTADHFGIDKAEMDERHHLTYDTYESGKMGLPAYLDRIIFYEPRPFTQKDVVDFILGEARAFNDMIDLVCGLKARHGIKVAVLSNEGREVTADRIRRFKLAEFVDFFIVSSYVHFRKPDEDIFRVALDIAQAEPERTVYIEDRQMFVEVAASLGLRALWHRGYEATRAALAELGLD